MKKLLTFVLLLTFVAVMNIKAQNLVDYNNEVLYHYTLLDNQIAKFEGAIWDEKVTTSQLKKEYNLCKNIVKYNGPVLRNIKQHPKDKYFLPSVIAFYSVVENTLNNEFKQIIDMYSQDWQESFGKKISELDKQAVDKIVKAEQDVIDNQKKFADANGLNLN